MEAIVTVDLSLFAQAIGPIYAQLGAGDRPIFVAFLERTLGDCYRRWAQDVSSPEARQALLETANREDQNAATVEARDPQAAARLKRLREAHPHLDTLVSSVLEGLPLHDQMRMLAAAERAGAGLYRAFADDPTHGPTAREELLECEAREHENAAALDTLATSVAALLEGVTPNE